MKNILPSAVFRQISLCGDWIFEFVYDSIFLWVAKSDSYIVFYFQMYAGIQSHLSEWNTVVLINRIDCVRISFVYVIEMLFVLLDQFGIMVTHRSKQFTIRWKKWRKRENRKFNFSQSMQWSKKQLIIS